MKKDEMGRACGMHKGWRGMHTGLWLENCKENNRLEDLGGEDRIILKSNLKKMMGGGGQDRSAS